MSDAVTLFRALRGGPLGLLQGDRSVGRRDLALDVFAFAGTVACATIFRWEAQDVIWGLWVSSLTVGYATIVSNVVRGVRDVLRGYKVLAVVGGLGALAFFTVHFGMFHFVHAVFLSGFFPLVESGEGSFDSLSTVAQSAASFWPLIVASFLSRLSDILPGSPAPSGKDFFAAPYANVIRMHLLIFVFAGLHMADLSRLAILPVLAAYFFPWKAVFRRARQGRG
ncbi:MAG: hypothetical protein KAW67_05215 [Candidatus Eisenbacteria sp.]|nr:hypothetical protein [Candidatus Eisenbacteria bacterium]